MWRERQVKSNNVMELVGSSYKLGRQGEVEALPLGGIDDDPKRSTKGSTIAAI